MKKRHGFSIVLVLLMISGCGGMRASYVDGQPFTDGHGLLAVGLESNWAAIKSDVQEDLQIRLFAKGLPPGLLQQLDFVANQYVALIELPARDYEFQDLVIANLWWELDSPTFTIRENSITYIGDIKVTIDHEVNQGYNDVYRAKVDVAARPDALREFLDRNYPLSLGGAEIDSQFTPITVR